MSGASANFRRSPDCEMIRISADGTHCYKEKKMSGECDKCGNHTLECLCKDSGPEIRSKFFFKGRFFEDENEFWQYTQQWPLLKTDQNTFFEEWQKLGNDIWTNNLLHRVDLTNGALNEILSNAFLQLLEKIFNEPKESFDGE